MVQAPAVVGIVVVALGMVLTPGPNMIYLVSRSISQGWRAGFVSLLGTATGFVVYMTMANVGLAVAQGDVVVQGFVLGGAQIAVSFVVNALIILSAAGVAALLARHPAWLRWQRRVTGALLAGVALHLVLDLQPPEVELAARAPGR